MQRELLVSAVEEGAAAGKRRGVCVRLKAAGKAPGGRRRRASGGRAEERPLPGAPGLQACPRMAPAGPHPECAGPHPGGQSRTALEFTAPPRLQVLRGRGFGSQARGTLRPPVSWSLIPGMVPSLAFLEPGFVGTGLTASRAYPE